MLYHMLFLDKKKNRHVFLFDKHVLNKRFKMNKMVQSASTLAEFILHIGLKKPYKTSIYHSLHGLANANSKCNRPIIWRFRMVYTRFGINIKLANFQNEFNYMLMSAAIMQQYAIEMMYVWFVTVPGRFAPNPVRPPSRFAPIPVRPGSLRPHLLIVL